ncbi:MAG: response regulator transcription factor [Ruminococcaceae bacterium]|nr:response regulator transcription factor [Oscillospiraceae bacterium]
MKICILTDNQRFYRMLELELTEMGFDVIEHKDIFSNLGAAVLCDLDFCEYELIKELSVSSDIYGWSSHDADENPRAQFCTCIFHRPFLMSELRQALSRYITGSQETAVSRQSPQKRVSEFGRRKNMLTCNHAKKEAVFGATSIPLSPAEADVLKLLCDRRGEVVTRQELEGLFGNPDGNITDVYICKLRSKIDNKLGVKFIYTVKGKGYVLK